jgi:hypothetical protein
MSVDVTPSARQCLSWAIFQKPVLYFTVMSTNAHGQKGTRQTGFDRTCPSTIRHPLSAPDPSSCLCMKANQAISRRIQPKIISWFRPVVVRWRWSLLQLSALLLQALSRSIKQKNSPPPFFTFIPSACYHKFGVQIEIQIPGPAYGLKMTEQQE